MTLINLQTIDTGTTSALAATLCHTLELTWDRPGPTPTRPHQRSTPRLTSTTY